MDSRGESAETRVNLVSATMAGFDTPSQFPLFLPSPVKIVLLVFAASAWLSLCSYIAFDTLVVGNDDGDTELSAEAGSEGAEEGVGGEERETGQPGADTSTGYGEEDPKAEPEPPRQLQLQEREMTIPQLENSAQQLEELPRQQEEPAQQQEEPSPARPQPPQQLQAR